MSSFWVFLLIHLLSSWMTQNSVKPVETKDINETGKIFVTTKGNFTESWTKLEQVYYWTQFAGRPHPPQVSVGRDVLLPSWGVPTSYCLSLAEALLRDFAEDSVACCHLCLYLPHPSFCFVETRAHDEALEGLELSTFLPRAPSWVMTGIWRCAQFYFIEFLPYSMPWSKIPDLQPKLQF